MSFQNANILVQKFINDYGNRTRTYRAINFIRDVSIANVKTTLDPNTFIKGPGKLRQVRINYFPIQCDTEGSCTGNLCDDGEVIEPAQTMFNITRCTASKVYKIQKDDIRFTDNDGWTFTGVALEIIGSILPDMRRNLAIDWLTYAYTLVGIHRDGNLTHRISPVNQGNGVVNAKGLLEIRKEYVDGGFQPPYVLGGDDIYWLQEMTKIGGLNAQGQQINRVDTANTYYDDGLSDIILDDTANGGHILSITPDAFKYVFYSENAGIFRSDMTSINDIGMLYSRGTNGFIEGVLVDPVTNILWDLDVNYDKCNKYWTVKLTHHWDFFVMPSVACNIQGVNGLMHWRTCPEVLLPCPTGDPMPSPASSHTYSWTPTTAYPFFAHSSQIGQIQNQPNANITSLDDLVAMFNDNGGGVVFTKSGSSIHYTGYSAISGNINGDINFTFA
jgi:hypothetical protein